MQIFTFDQDITAICATAESFPAGIHDAHERLHNAVRFTPVRRYFGISYPDGKGGIVYHAAAEIAPEDDAAALGFSLFTIKKGQYLSLLVPNFKDDIPAIGRAIQQLRADPRIAPGGFCLEMWRLHEDDLLCMIPMAEGRGD